MGLQRHQGLVQTAILRKTRRIMIFARGAGRRAAGNRMRRFDAVSALSWFSAGMLLAGCSAPAVQSGARQRTNMNSQCVGRFGFQAPNKLTVGGQSQSIY